MLKSIFSKFRNTVSNNVRPSRLRVESLEERKLLSADGAIFGGGYDGYVEPEVIEGGLVEEEIPSIDLSAVSGEVTGVLGTGTVLADVATKAFDDPTFVCSVDGEATDAVRVEDGQLIYSGELDVAVDGVNVRSANFTVVVAASEGDAYAETTFDLTVSRFQLGDLQNVLFVDSTVTWDAVENAGRYTVDLYNGDERVSRTETGSRTFCTFDNLEEGGDYSVVVYANAYQAITSTSGQTPVAQPAVELSPYSGDVTSVFDENVVLAEISTVALDNPTFACLVDGQESDAVKIEDGQLIYVGGLIVVDLVRTQEYEITVTAQDADDCVSATYTLTVHRFFLDSAGNVVVDGVSDTSATIAWDAVENADRYTVDLYANGERVSRTETYAQTSLTVTDLTPETEYTARVYANAYQAVTSVSDVEFTTEEYVEPSISLSTDSSSVTAVLGQGDVLAQVSTEGLDNPTFVCKINGEVTDAVAVIDGQLVYVGELSVASGVRSTTFTVEVIASDAQNSVEASIDVKVNRFALANPINVTVDEVGETTAVVSWDAVEYADSYTVDVYANGERIKRLGAASKTSVTVKGLDANAGYEVRVYANAYQAITSVSNVVSFETAGEVITER